MLLGERIDPKKPMQMYIEFAREDTKNEKLVENNHAKNASDDCASCSMTGDLTSKQQQLSCSPNDTTYQEKSEWNNGTYGDCYGAAFPSQVFPFPFFPPFYCSYYPFNPWSQTLPNVDPPTHQ